MRLTEEQIKRVEGAIRAGATKSSVIAKRLGLTKEYVDACMTELGQHYEQTSNA